MATNQTITFTGTLVDGAGAAVTSANVKAQRVDVSTLEATTLSASDTASATSNSSTGIFSLSLTGYDLMPVTYKITLPDGQYFYLPIPANAKSSGIGKVTVSGGGPAKSAPKDITGQIVPKIRWVGQDLASATALPEPTCHIHTVTGTTAITSVTSTNTPAGFKTMLVFASTPTFTDGNNLKLAGNLVATADDSISIEFDGTNFIEAGRSVN